MDVWQHDILIPKKYGVDTNVGDTRGPSGIFRFVRTVNPILDIARDIDRYCPGAVFLMDCRLTTPAAPPWVGALMMALRLAGMDTPAAIASLIQSSSQE